MNWFASLMHEIGVFLGLCGAPAVKVSMDILGQVAQGGTTPTQVIATVADLKALNDSISAAAAACSKMDGSETHSVITGPTADITAMVNSGGA